MKARPLPLPYALVLLIFTAACNRPCDDVVCETYVHRYGVPLSPEDWENRGQHGQVVSVRKDGVVITRSYDAGTMHGETTYTFPHRDIIQKREVYDQGVLTQEYWNYSNGMPYKQTTHLSPTSQSIVIWYDNGAPQCREEYESGLLMRGEYLTPNNIPEAVIENQNGIRLRRDRYGQLESTDQICEGQMVQRTTYHPNGAPQSITPYRNDVAEGQKHTFLPGGEPNTIEEWSKGYQHGRTFTFENGEKISNIPYRRGQIHGKEYRYREDGKTVVEEVSWVEGKKHGACNTYVGNSKQTSWYFQDMPVNKPTFDALSNQ